MNTTKSLCCQLVMWSTLIVSTGWGQEETKIPPQAFEAWKRLEKKLPEFGHWYVFMSATNNGSVVPHSKSLVYKQFSKTKWLIAEQIIHKNGVWDCIHVVDGSSLFSIKRVNPDGQWEPFNSDRFKHGISSKKLVRKNRKGKLDLDLAGFFSIETFTGPLPFLRLDYSDLKELQITSVSQSEASSWQIESKHQNGLIVFEFDDQHWRPTKISIPAVGLEARFEYSGGDTGMVSSAEASSSAHPWVYKTTFELISDKQPNANEFEPSLYGGEALRKSVEAHRLAFNKSFRNWTGRRTGDILLEGYRLENPASIVARNLDRQKYSIYFVNRDGDRASLWASHLSVEDLVFIKSQVMAMRKARERLRRENK